MNRRGMLQAAVAALASIPLARYALPTAESAPSLALLKTKAEQVKELLEVNLRLMEGQYPDVRFWVEGFNGGLIVAAHSRKQVDGKWFQLGYLLTESDINDRTYLATFEAMTPRLVRGLDQAIAVALLDCQGAA